MDKKALTALKHVAAQLKLNDEFIELTRPEPQFGDFSTNLALRASKQQQRNPREVAMDISAVLTKNLPSGYKIDIAGPGFINITLPDSEYLAALQSYGQSPETIGSLNSLSGKTVLVEFTDPNPFKELHIGHVYANTIGEAIARLFEAAGATVKRVSYHGDVGLHVAKAMWGIQQALAKQNWLMTDVPEENRAQFLGESYAAGAHAYDNESKAKQEIVELNKKIYEIDQHTELNDIYQEGKKWSFEYFDTIYQRLNSHFDKQFFESEAAKIGLEATKKGLAKGVFEESNGAIVFKGENYGLHTRVFVNSEGLPTYEAKDLGLAPLKAQAFKYDQSVIITAEEQSSYFKVVLQALRIIEPALGENTKHIAHGVVKLSSGKMSSRTGKVITAKSLLDAVEEATAIANPQSPAITENATGAIKYALLKHRIGGDIIYDVGESISMEGNSGPYLQYAHARARRIISKASSTAQIGKVTDLRQAEKELARHLLAYEDELRKAIKQLSPHIICTYLYELAQTFNRFYEHNHVIGDEREGLRLLLVQVYADTMKRGLETLNISAPNSM